MGFQTVGAPEAHKNSIHQINAWMREKYQDEQMKAGVCVKNEISCSIVYRGDLKSHRGLLLDFIVFSILNRQYEPRSK